MDVEIAFTGVAVSDLARGREFFERLFGKPPDALVNENEVMWRVSRRNSRSTREVAAKRSSSTTTATPPPLIAVPASSGERVIGS
jgi:hypothetical protein